MEMPLDDNYIKAIAKELFSLKDELKQTAQIKLDSIEDLQEGIDLLHEITYRANRLAEEIERHVEA